MNLPGTDLVEVVPQGAADLARAARLLVVALLFLLGMLASLAALRRDFIKRQQVQQRLQAEVALRSAMERSVTIGMRAWDMTGQDPLRERGLCSMVGYSAQELRGASAPLPYWPADQADELALLHRASSARARRPRASRCSSSTATATAWTCSSTKPAERRRRHPAGLDEFGGRHQRAQARPATGRTAAGKASKPRAAWWPWAKWHPPWRTS